MFPSGSEILLIVIAAFILFGGKQLREFMRKAGKITRKVQNAARDFQRELNIDASDDDESKKPDLKG
ncbi:MAG TPA: twin-arginine translocase TatA/TatE family subunit [bacterium]|jgi:Sec-independent protein translocase protein TatA